MLAIWGSLVPHASVCDQQGGSFCEIGADLAVELYHTEEATQPLASSRKWVRKTAVTLAVLGCMQLLPTWWPG